MSDLFPQGPSGSNQGFFSKPENIVTSVLVVIAAALGVYFFSSLQAVFWAACSGLLGLISLFAIAGTFLWLLFGKFPREFYKETYAIAVRRAWRWLIEKSPSEFAQNYIQKLTEKKNEFEKQKELVTGEYKSMGREMEENNREIQKYLEQAVYAQKAGKPREQVAQLSSQAEILKGSMERMLPKYQELGLMVQFLGRSSEAIKYRLDQIVFEVGVKQKEYERLKRVGKATAAAKAVMGADSDEHRRFEQSMQVMEDSITFHMAEFDNLMTTYEGLLSSAEANKGAVLERGLGLLDRYISGEQVSLDLTTPTKAEVPTLPPAIQIPTIAIQTQGVKAPVTSSTSKWV